MDNIQEPPFYTRFLSLNFSNLLILLCAFFATYIVSTAVYSAYFHPLSHIPGPKLYAASYIVPAWHSINGRRPFMIHKLHEKYGDVVRFSPNHVSFCTGDAYKELYSNKPGRGQLMKDPGSYLSFTVAGIHNILTTPSDEDHSRFRRLLAHGFSEKATREQESVVLGYVDLLIQRLHECAKEGPQDLVSWYNWTTFDLIGDLTFNESFQCLEKSAYHPWIEFIFGGFKAGSILNTLKQFPVAARVLNFLLKDVINEKMAKNAAFSRQKTANRITANTDRLDFLGYVLRHKGTEKEMSIAEIESTSSVLVLGGSETTATMLSGATYLLLTNRHVLDRLVAEIRGHFANEGDINMVSVNKLTYELAVLEEAMRFFPPAPLGSMRKLPPQGDTILGHELPGDTVVLATNYAACHSSRNWKDADSFIPERWLDHPDYKDDNKSSSQPFSVGPRNCIGRNLAYAEMRVIIARLIWNFDMELSQESMNWMESLKIFGLWEKLPLMVKLTPRAR
ncbi:hypothetical protein BP6252_12139 [Coleophoma cylindrospora]|uniref:Uncharacterized protein n=1 Tax=Coleophoma cylindrospora TaxID=1849047 RepID=A0A3D8QFX4_9HELO|nr:hypothetical protein BP6252_12139 [Coleophoma cylindrospora]